MPTTKVLDISQPLSLWIAICHMNWLLQEEVVRCVNAPRIYPGAQLGLLSVVSTAYPLVWLLLIIQCTSSNAPHHLSDPWGPLSSDIQFHLSSNNSGVDIL